MISIGETEITPSVKGATKLYIGDKFVAPMKNAQKTEENNETNESEQNKDSNENE